MLKSKKTLILITVSMLMFLISCNQTASSNSDTLYSLIRNTTNNLRYFNSEDTRDASMLLSQLTSNYMDSDSITNPFTQSKDIHTIVGKDSYVNNSKFKDDEEGSVIILFTSELLANDGSEGFSENDITFACNEHNKGYTIGIIFFNGFVTYEIDESGRKINQKISYK
ncbi:MAG: hypothetical protein GX387_03115 [Clostridium sp.]|jgi:hypothetical protein|nr:hypothetical protein [Clostridium sp.]